MFALALTSGCSLYFGSSDDDDAGMITLEDAMPLDAGVVCLSACNPLAQTGCMAGEKCSPPHDPFEPGCGYTRCVPDGDVPTGGVCAVVPSGFDDCMGGDLCVGDECKRMCSQWPDSCDESYACVPLPDVYDLLDLLGVCEPVCDVLAQDCAQAPEDEHGTGCYLRLQAGTAVCRPARAELDGGVPGLQGDACTYLDTCAVGYACTQLDDPVPSGNVCAFFCDADDNGGPTCADGPGDPLTCVAINGGFYGDATSVPMNIGFCVDCVVWADVPGCQ